MAFVRYANAYNISPSVSQRGWGKIRKTAAAPSRDIMAQAAEILGGPLDPDRYLLTHCTIVASVDVDNVPNVRLGKVRVGSKTINRKWSDYHIRPQCSQWVNNNGDSWSREVLKIAYPTFTGGQNFCEHVQIEEQSKGRILDAVGRDIGDSLYVDILVATDRKHTQLIQDIETQKMGTLSMGCFLGDAQVSMADGTRTSIEDVQVGDMVLTHKGNARAVVNKQLRKGDWRLIRIQAVGVPSTVVATDNHPFFVFRAPETCACGCGESLPAYSAKAKRHNVRRMTRRFKKGHDKRVLNPNAVYSLDEHRDRQARMDAITALKMEEVQAGDLRVGDFLCFPRAQFGVVPGDESTIGRARLLGYYLAEGSFLKYKGDPVETQFNFSMREKETYVAEVVDLLQKEFPGTNPWVQDRPDRDTCVVHVYSREVAAWFLQHGGEYSNRKRVSADVMQWPAEIQAHLIGAWINGDGSLSRGVTSGVTTSYDLACQMHVLLTRCGFFARMLCGVQGKAVEVLEVINGGVSVRDEETGRFPSFTLEVGQTQAVALTPYTSKAPVTATREFQTLRVLDNVVMFPITSLEEEPYTGWVHNMEVEEDHSYIVEGVAVHNCTCVSTTCSKCGNVAVDETELCDCIKYAKRNYFVDDHGQRRIIAELCGHPSIEPNAGVNFIEASWVATPAFTGAVLRNVLTPGQVSAKAAAILNTPPPQWTGATRAASSHVAFGPFDDGEEAPAPPKEPESSPLEDAVNEIEEAVTERAVKKLKDQVKKKDVQDAIDSPMSPNDNVTKEAYTKGVQAILKNASSDIALIDRFAALNQAHGIQMPRAIYRAALAAGPAHLYPSMGHYLRACSHAVGRPVAPAEARVMARIGTLLSRRASNKPCEDNNG